MADQECVAAYFQINRIPAYASIAGLICQLSIINAPNLVLFMMLYKTYLKT